MLAQEVEGQTKKDIQDDPKPAVEESSQVDTDVPEAKSSPAPPEPARHQ